MMPVLALSLPPDLLQELASHATDLGTDSGGTHYWRVQVPLRCETLLRDLRWAGSDPRVVATAWASPQARAILLASEGHALLAAYPARGQGYERAVTSAGRGIMPTPPREQEIER